MSTTVFDPKISLKVLAALKKHPDASPFLKPVDWKRMGLTDYPDIVKKPMDLQTVGRKLRDGAITSEQSFFEDLELIWENCRTYNESGTEIYTMAENMEKEMLRLIRELVEVETQKTLPQSLKDKLAAMPEEPETEQPTTGTAEEEDSRSGKRVRKSSLPKTEKQDVAVPVEVGAKRRRSTKETMPLEPVVSEGSPSAGGGKRRESVKTTADDADDKAGTNGPVKTATDITPMPKADKSTTNSQTTMSDETRELRHILVQLIRRMSPTAVGELLTQLVRDPDLRHAAHTTPGAKEVGTAETRVDLAKLTDDALQKLVSMSKGLVGQEKLTGVGIGQR